MDVIEVDTIVLVGEQRLHVADVLIVVVERDEEEVTRAIGRTLAEDQLMRHGDRRLRPSCSHCVVTCVCAVAGPSCCFLPPDAVGCASGHDNCKYYDYRSHLLFPFGATCCTSRLLLWLLLVIPNVLGVERRIFFDVIIDGNQVLLIGHDSNFF